MRAVVTVIGKDTVGILHKVSGICAEYNVNVIICWSIWWYVQRNVAKIYI